MTREEFQKQISDSVKAKNSNSKEFMNVVNAISMINNLGERPAAGAQNGFYSHYL